LLLPTPSGITQGHLAGVHRHCRRSLQRFGFRRVQGSVYVTDSDDMANLFRALLALKGLAWFPASVRDIRLPH
jgi:virulence-associated protein VapD